MVVVETDILRVAVHVAFGTRTVGTCNPGDTAVVRAIVPRGTVAVDCTRWKVDADIIRAVFARRTVRVDVTPKSRADTNIVDTRIPAGTLGVVVAGIRLLTDCVLRVTYIPGRTVRVGRTPNRKGSSRSAQQGRRDSEDETHR
jgi:hypothetical protein